MSVIYLISTRGLTIILGGLREELMLHNTRLIKMGCTIFPIHEEAKWKKYFIGMIIALTEPLPFVFLNLEASLF